MPLSPALFLALWSVQPSLAGDTLGQPTAPVEGADTMQLQPDPQRPRPRVEVLQTLHKDNQTQMALATVALQRSDDPVIRRFARRLLRDHRFADRRVTALASRVQVDLDVLSDDGDGPGLVQMQAILLGLQDLQGEALDTAFLERVVQSHQQQVLHLSRLRNELASDPVRELVNAWVPILELHLRVGQNLLASRPIS